MEHAQHIVFGPFRLGLTKKRLWRGEQELELRPMAVAVLRYLAERPRQLVSKEELLKQVWAGTIVTKTALKVCVREIRQALGDEVSAPRYIETVGRLGYRFIAPLTTAAPPVHSSRLTVQGSESESAPSPQSPALIVGREAELDQIHSWLDQALRGTRQVVFITGEPGVGKTTVVDLFLERMRAGGEVRIGRGQCLERYGEGEAYMPVLEALEQVCGAPDGQAAVEILSRYAPTWLLQMPALVEETMLAALQRRVIGATRERMLREIAAALEALTVQQGLVLVFEDLQASDRSTMELLTYLVQRRERARLLIMGTYRPADVVVKGHPLKGVVQELRAHAYCQELRLELLGEEDVAEYLTKRLGVGTVPKAVVEQIHWRTDGNALFLVNVVEYLLRRGLLSEVAGQWQLRLGLEAVGIPESLRQMIEKQIERLGEEDRLVLVTANVQGYEFDSAVVSKALARDPAEVEERLAVLEHAYELVRLISEDELPDRTLTLRYRFVHMLYQHVFYALLTPTRRAKVSGAVAQALRGYYGEWSSTVATELAHHYEVAREFTPAADYYLLAAQNATRVFAHTEAAVLARRGLAMLAMLPQTPERAQRELVLQLTLGFTLGVTQGYAAPEAGESLNKAHELCQQLGEVPQLFPAIWGLLVYDLVVPDYQAARQMGEQLLRLAQRAQDPLRQIGAHAALGFTLLHLGELMPSHNHLERAITLHDPQQHHAYLSLYSLDPGLYCLSNTVRSLWLLGYPDQSRRRMHEAVARAQGAADPRSLAFALHLEVVFRLFYGEVNKALEQAEVCIAHCREYSIAQEREWTAVYRGAALAEQGQVEEGIAQIRASLAALHAMQAENTFPHFLALLAEALGKTGQIEEGLVIVNEALSIGQRTGEGAYEAEVYRLKGELSLQSRQVKTSQNKSEVTNPQSLTPNSQAKAEECFHKAIEVARRQSAKSLELRAVMSLSRLWRQQGKKKQARQMLTEIYGWFTEGFDTADLQAAKMLLQELTH